MTITRSTENWRLDVDLTTGVVRLLRADISRENGTVIGIPQQVFPGKECSLSDVQTEIDALIAKIGVLVPDANPTPDQLKAYAATARWRKETGGITVDLGGGVSVPVATDDRSKLMIMGAAQSAAQDANYTTPWKTTTGEFVTLNAAQIETIASAVAAHVQSCFATEDQVVAGIDASPATITTTAEIDTAFA